MTEPVERGRLRKRAAAWTLSLLLFLALAAWALRAPLLTGAARWLTVDDRPARGDFVYVLGGELHTRPFHAARLYRAGVAPRVVLARVRDLPATELGLFPNETDVSVRVLRRLGVPDSAIVVLRLPGGASSTAEEARALRDHLRRTGARRVVVVTNAYHTRRARWALRRGTRGVPAEILMSPARARGFDETDWWRSEEGLITYLNEYIKFGFYLVHH